MLSALSYTAATFPSTVAQRTVRTPEATIAAFVSHPPSNSESQGERSLKPNPVLLLIHGNSASSLIWRHVFVSPLAETHTIVAFDLPGHGSSGDADHGLDAGAVYTQRAYGRVALAVLDEVVGSGEVVVLGWSLGGHVAIEMCDLLERGEQPLKNHRIKIGAICITGSPPVPLGGVAFGFLENKHVSFASVAVLSPDELTVFAEHMTLGPYESWMHDSVVRTDGRAREIMFATFKDGSGVCDQKACVERLTAGNETVVAVINGAAEPFVDINWIREGIAWGPGLWRGKCFEVGGGHAPFWEDWDSYWPLLKGLMEDVAKTG